MRRNDRMQGSTERVSDNGRSFDRKFWKQATPVERIEAMFEMRDFYYQVILGENVPRRMDRPVGGTRRRGDD
ncbi:MAG: hypothetical protein ACK4P3_07620 [Fimbriimonadaceae bacterium]